MKKCMAFALIFVLLLCPIKANAVSVSSKAAALINGDTGEVIYTKNATDKLSMASTTKIMTGLLLCEYGNFEREITVTPEMLRVEGSSMGLLAGDRVTLHDLLYGLMLASGNDAANVIAFTLGGSIDGFVKQMNDKAKELGLKNTSFATPSGLDDQNHYTTALELALLTRYAMQNEEFAKAVATQKATLSYGNPPYKRTLTNHNKLLKMYDGALGVKTGFTKKSGRCLVSAAKRDGKFVIAVTLNAPNDWQDHKEMLDYGFSKIKQTNYIPPASSYNLPVINGQSEALSVDIEPFTVNSLETDDISCDIYLPKFLYAPIEKDEVIGKAVYKQGDRVLAEKPLLSKTVLEEIIDNFKYILENL